MPVTRQYIWISKGREAAFNRREEKKFRQQIELTNFLQNKRTKEADRREEDEGTWCEEENEGFFF